jgi:N-acetyl-anhydromuramyl-L-alanine amidase AmpD
MRSIHTIVVHCTATPAGRHVTVEDVDLWHRQRGWSGIGYHTLVGLRGEIWQGRPEHVTGAHVRGFNAGSLGVAYVGGGNAAPYRDTRTVPQKEAILAVLDEWLARYPIERIVGHRDLDPTKACPCFDATAEYAHLLGGDEDTKPSRPPKDEMLALGSTGEDVREWQRRLVEFGYGWLAVDGSYGAETGRMTKAFQAARGIVSDGIVGPQTRETMADVLEALELLEA